MSKRDLVLDLLAPGTGRIRGDRRPCGPTAPAVPSHLVVRPEAVMGTTIAARLR